MNQQYKFGYRYDPVRQNYPYGCGSNRYAAGNYPARYEQERRNARAYEVGEATAYGVGVLALAGLGYAIYKSIWGSR